MDGIILINKPIDYTSRDIVNIIGKKLNTKKIGHTGTLDPMAEGVLVLCCGKALKIVELLTSYDKEYLAEITLGIETDTLDITGKILSEDSVENMDKNKIIAALNSFIGTYNQEVPKYSAIKVNGRKLYDYARNNVEVILPKREVTIKTIELIGDLKYQNNKLIFTIKTEVSKGTYIRSLIRDIGKSLGYSACMSKLVRLKQGEFDISECQNINDDYKTIPIKEVLKDMNQLIVDENMEFKIRNGQVLDRFFDSNICLALSSNGEELAIYKISDDDYTKARPFKMFNS